MSGQGPKASSARGRGQPGRGPGRGRPLNSEVLRPPAGSYRLFTGRVSAFSCSRGVTEPGSRPPVQGTMVHQQHVSARAGLALSWRRPTRPALMLQSRPSSSATAVPARPSCCLITMSVMTSASASNTAGACFTTRVHARACACCTKCRALPRPKRPPGHHSLPLSVFRRTPACLDSQRMYDCARCTAVHARAAQR